MPVAWGRLDPQTVDKEGYHCIFLTFYKADPLDVTLYEIKQEANADFPGTMLIIIS